LFDGTHELVPEVVHTRRRPGKIDFAPCTTPERTTSAGLGLDCIFI
jgi:hypothetical protein